FWPTFEVTRSPAVDTRLRTGHRSRATVGAGGGGRERSAPPASGGTAAPNGRARRGFRMRSAPDRAQSAAEHLRDPLGHLALPGEVLRVPGRGEDDAIRAGSGRNGISEPAAQAIGALVRRPGDGDRIEQLVVDQ